MLKCQACGIALQPALVDLGYLPPPNDYRKIGVDPTAQIWMPTQVYHCGNCQLVQLGYVAPKQVVFPITYPYISGATKLLRDNFVDLAEEAEDIADLQNDDLIVDIGANDGTLLNSFTPNYKRLAIEPTDAIKRVPSNIEKIQSYFSAATADFVRKHHGLAKLVTCTNCFAHVEDPHGFIGAVKSMLHEDGVFVTESHYLMDLLRTLQYDTIYHEHLRYYSLHSLHWLFEHHGMEIFHVRHIRTHGGSIRVYAARKDAHIVKTSVDTMMHGEPTGEALGDAMRTFANDVLASKVKLLTTLTSLKASNQRVAAIGAPSRAATVVNYCRLDTNLIECTYEISNSPKINHYMPGTNLRVVDESRLWADPPDQLLLFSWHLAEELKNKLREKGYGGAFLLPI